MLSTHRKRQIRHQRHRTSTAHQRWLRFGPALNTILLSDGDQNSRIQRSKRYRKNKWFTAVNGTFPMENIQSSHSIYIFHLGTSIKSFTSGAQVRDEMRTAAKKRITVMMARLTQVNWVLHWKMHLYTLNLLKYPVVVSLWPVRSYHTRIIHITHTRFFMS